MMFGRNVRVSGNEIGRTQIIHQRAGR
jgi:hypothetical protein